MTDAERRGHDQVVKWDELQRELNHLSRALDIQATEYARRLTELNHAHEQAQANWRQSLPRELFDRFQGEWHQWRETNRQDMDRIRDDLTREIKLVSETTSAFMNRAIGGGLLITFILAALALWPIFTR